MAASVGQRVNLVAMMDRNHVANAMPVDPQTNRYVSGMEVFDGMALLGEMQRPVERRSDDYVTFQAEYDTGPKATSTIHIWRFDSVTCAAAAMVGIIATRARRIRVVTNIFSKPRSADGAYTLYDDPHEVGMRTKEEEFKLGVYALAQQFVGSMSDAYVSDVDLLERQHNVQTLLQRMVLHFEETALRAIYLSAVGADVLATGSFEEWRQSSDHTKAVNRLSMTHAVHNMGLQQMIATYTSFMMRNGIKGPLQVLGPRTLVTTELMSFDGAKRPYIRLPFQIQHHNLPTATGSAFTHEIDKISNAGLNVPVTAIPLTDGSGTYYYYDPFDLPDDSPLTRRRAVQMGAPFDYTGAFSDAVDGYTISFPELWTTSSQRKVTPADVLVSMCGLFDDVPNDLDDDPWTVQYDANQPPPPGTLWRQIGKYAQMHGTRDVYRDGANHQLSRSVMSYGISNMAEKLRRMQGNLTGVRVIQRSSLFNICVDQIRDANVALIRPELRTVLSKSILSVLSSPWKNAASLSLVR